MKFTRTVRTATIALRRNLMRAALTTLGIVIGVAAVIAMMELGKGSATAMRRTIESMGANALQVTPGQAASGGISFGAGSVLTLTAADCDAILRDCPALKSAAPVVRASGQIVYLNKNYLNLTFSDNNFRMR